MYDDSKLRDAIVAAVPEIEELKFGCRGIKYAEVWVLTHNGWQTEKGSWQGKSLMPKENIIGRPITLADVWQAIFKAKSWRGAALQEQTRIAFNVVITWPKEDNLDRLSDDGKRYLASIICP